MEVRLRRSIGGSEGEAGACWLEDGGEGDGSNGSYRRGEEQQAAEEEARRRRRSQASALLAHQNLLLSPGDRGFGYRSASSELEEEEEERLQQPPAAGSPSAADILRGPMRFGASVLDTSPPRSPPAAPPQHAPGSASKQLPKPSRRQLERRRSSLLSESAHRIVCGVRLAKEDLGSILLLLVLYTLQGIPLGLAATVPFMLQERVSYKQQALFSLVSLPFSAKLLWAPVVDSTRFLGLGRRKAWLLPVQFLCGLMMLAAAPRVGGWMGDEPAGGVPQVRTLTAYFFALYALMATQDIAVDGWALTMLSRENVGLASTTNTIGQTLGYFLAHVGFLALHSPETCNKFLRSEPRDTGMVTLGGFLSFWGWVFLVTTLMVAWKREDDDHASVSAAQHSPSVLATYRRLGQILRLPPVRQMCAVLLTMKAGFAATDSASSLKLIEYGMPKEEIALMSPLLIATSIAVPLLLAKATSGPRPLSLFLRSYAPRLGVGLLYGALLPLATRAYAGSGRHTATGAGRSGAAPTLFRVLFLTVVGLREVAANAQFIAQMAFFARVADPSIGGTYMTLLNTVSNLGSSWVRTVSLALLDPATKRECRPILQAQGIDSTSAADALAGIRCKAAGGPTLCQSAGGACQVLVDGWYVQLVFTFFVGIAWLAVFRPVLLRLEALPASAWCLKPPPSSSSRREPGPPPPFSSPSSSSHYHQSAATTRRRGGDNGGGTGDEDGGTEMCKQEQRQPLLMGVVSGAGAAPPLNKAKQ